MGDPPQLQHRTHDKDFVLGTTPNQRIFRYDYLITAPALTLKIEYLYRCAKATAKFQSRQHEKIFHACFTKNIGDQ